LRLSVFFVAMTVCIVADSPTAEAQGLAYLVGGLALHGGGVVNGGAGYQAAEARSTTLPYDSAWLSNNASQASKRTGGPGR
jgi:hypothetical protein